MTLDIWAALVSLTGCGLLASNTQYSKWAYPIFIFGNALWIYYGLTKKQRGNVIANMGYLFMNIFGLWRWFE